MLKIKTIHFSLLLTFLFVLFVINAHARNEYPSPPKGILKLPPYPAPEIKISDIDGKPYNLSNNKSHWIFVHFWASWCVPCRKEMPAIQKMWRNLKKQGLKIALINTAEDEDTIFNFLGIYAPDIRALMDADGTATEKWKPRGLPATYLVDPAGSIQYQALGGRPWDKPVYLNFLKKLLSKK